jgi:hypothetical protein
MKDERKQRKCHLLPSPLWGILQSTPKWLKGQVPQQAIPLFSSTTRQLAQLPFRPTATL